MGDLDPIVTGADKHFSGGKKPIVKNKNYSENP
jgi:hypothetical protein